MNKIVAVTFWIGVNIIGLPVCVEHFTTQKQKEIRNKEYKNNLIPS